jgi:hypothetical protein
MAEDIFPRVMRLLDLVFQISGIIFLFIGFAGVVMSIAFYNMGLFGDYIDSVAFLAVYIFMSIMGIILILFHSKIIVT